MEPKQYEALMKELKILKKLLAATLYANRVDYKDIHKITGMSSSDIQGLLSLKKLKKRQSNEGKT